MNLHYIDAYIDYIDEDVAYLLGAIIARGEIDYSRGLITIRYPYRYLKMDGQPTWESIVISLDPVVNRIQSLGFIVSKNAIGPGADVSLTIQASPTSIQMRLLKQLLKSKTNYREFELPDVLWQSSTNIVKEFVRGYCDVAAHIRASNRDESGFHRVYIDVLFQNWKLPVQLCNLIQEKIGVPIHTIAWGHPNIRDPKAKHPSGWWKKEHQIKTYAHDFLVIGFYIKYKQELLEKYANENKDAIKEGRKPRHGRCKCTIKVKRPRNTHPDENDPDLPPEIRGQHINSYIQICKALGCRFCQQSLERWL